MPVIFMISSVIINFCHVHVPLTCSKKQNVTTFGVPLFQNGCCLRFVQTDVFWRLHQVNHIINTGTESKKLFQHFRRSLYVILPGSQKAEQKFIVTRNDKVGIICTKYCIIIFTIKLNNCLKFYLTFQSRFPFWQHTFNCIPEFLTIFGDELLLLPNFESGFDPQPFHL